ncbi:MAG: hypothetical protein P8Z68_09900, partial [Kineosporiaceae bacterium]
MADLQAGTAVTLDAALERWSAGKADRAPIAEVIAALASAGARLARMVAVAPLTAGPTADGPGTNASGDEHWPQGFGLIFVETDNHIGCHVYG